MKHVETSPWPGAVVSGGSRGGGWIVLKQIYVAANNLEAEMLKSVLEARGLTVFLEPLGVPHLGDARDTAILVPWEQVKEALQVLASSPSSSGTEVEAEDLGQEDGF